MVEEWTLLNATEVNDASREKTFVKLFLEAAKRSQPVTTPRSAKSWWTEEVRKRRKFRNLENCCSRQKVNSKINQMRQSKKTKTAIIL